MPTRLILVGGFLGAGKTTLLWESARRLMNRGIRIGLITNDQAPALVDTAFLSHGAAEVAEVSGSCFCCNFQGLLGAASKLCAKTEIDILLAEPVGSCTDLSATIVQPLKEHFHNDFVVSPLSVIVDPERLSSILDSGTAGLHPSAAYIFEKQIEEADIIVINKTDLLSAIELEQLKSRVLNTFPGGSVFAVSAKNGEGLDVWLDAVTRRVDSGRHLVEVDYDIYAEGEAVLGWLNASVMLRGKQIEWNDFAERLLKDLSRRFDELNAAVGHVKIIITADDEFLIGNLTGKSDTLSIRGSIVAGCESQLTINARVQMPSKELDVIVCDVVAAATRGCLEVTPLAWRCLSPGRPNPTYRYDHVVTVKEA